MALNGDTDPGSWPILPDGTVDWATVFEATDTGLIALIDGADTEDKLKACCQVVIHHLFQRDSDASYRFEYLRHLDQLFTVTGSGEFLLTLKGRIRVLLRRMKTERMERALAHARQRNGNTTAEDRRRLAEDDPLAPLRAMDAET